MLNIRKAKALRLLELLVVNYEAELRVACYLAGGIKNLLVRRSKNGFPGIIRQVTIARAVEAKMGSTL